MSSSSSHILHSTISFEESLRFYSLNKDLVPVSRPYTWSMTVKTLDGFISFNDKGAEVGKDIALGNLDNDGSKTDWWLLNLGWTFADAVLGSAEILRAEKFIKWIPNFPSLIEYRENVLGKYKYPINVIVTGSGNFDLNHPIIQDPSIQVIVFTTPQGNENIHKNLASSKQSLPNTQIEVIDKIIDPSTISELGWHLIVEILKKKYNVNYLDVTAGGKVIGSFLWNKLLDEIRLTISAQIIGGLNEDGKERTPFIVLPKTEKEHKYFSVSNSPLISYTNMKFQPPYHIFIRGDVTYRH